MAIYRLSIKNISRTGQKSSLAASAYRSEEKLKKVAQEAKDNFPKVEDLLRGFNEDTWKNLWEAARNYSETEAYRNKTFPCTEEAQCVLCQQPLDESSKKRLQSFEKFYQDKTQKEVEKAEEDYAIKRGELEKLRDDFTEEYIKEVAKMMVGLAHVEKSLGVNFEKATLQNIQRIHSFLEGTAIPKLPESIDLIKPFSKQFPTYIRNLTKELVTESFEKSFNDKLEFFKLHNLQGLKFNSSAAGSLPTIQLKVSGQSVSNILSRGEQRCIAIAAFLAEVEQAGNKSTLVFDDPVSSLNRNHREQVAECLVNIGQDQQVIIFIYDREFAEKLMPEFAKKSSLSLGKYKVESNDGKIGVCTSI